MLNICFNRNVLIGLGVAALGVLAFAPDAFFAMLPLLVVLACPLSMVVMMWAMRRQGPTGDQRRTSSSSQGEGGDAIAAGSEAPSSELVRLRAEVDQLRAELADNQPASQPDPSI